MLGFAVAATRPGSVSAQGGGALVAEPIVSASAGGVRQLFGASPEEAGGEVWGVGETSKGEEDMLRYTDEGGWEPMAEPVDEEGTYVSGIEIPEGALAGRTDPAGGVAAFVVFGPEKTQGLLVRDPAGQFRIVVPPKAEEGKAEEGKAEEGKAEEGKAEEGKVEEGLEGTEELFEAPSGPLKSQLSPVAVEEPTGKTGVFIAPSTSSPKAILHYDGSRWSREKICSEAAPAPCKPLPGASRLLGLDASSTGNAWLLGAFPKTGFGEKGARKSIVLFRREGDEWHPQDFTGQLSLHYGPEESTIGTTKVLINAKENGQPLTVTSNGVWVNAAIRFGTKEAPPSDATIYFDIGAGDSLVGQVTGAWCNLPSTTAAEVTAALCTGELPSDLPRGQGRSFAWPGTGKPGDFGTRAITGVGKGAMLIFENGSFTQVPLAGNGGSVAGAALSSTDEGWLGPSYRLTREPVPSALASWPVPFRHPLTAITSQPGAPVGEINSQALAVGEEGQVAKYFPGVGWQPEPLLTGSGSRATPNLRAVAWPVPGLAYAVGDEGAMWIWRAGTDLWEADPGSPPNLIRGNFTGIAFDPQEPERGYAVGQQGLLLAYGRSWTQESLPPELGSEPNFTSIAFAGNEAIATWSKAIPPTENSNEVAEFVGGVIVNGGSGWQVEPQATEALKEAVGPRVRALPRLVAGLPDGGAVIASETGEILEREGPGAPWHVVSGPPVGNPAALAAAREGGQLRAIVSVEANAANSATGPRTRVEEPQGAVKLEEDQAPLLIEPYPLQSAGYIVRQTAAGWRDEERDSYPAPPAPTDQTSSALQMDMPKVPDAVLALLVSPDGSQGWAVGGQTGLMANAPAPAGTREREGLQSAGVMRFGAGAAPPQNFSQVPLVVPPGEATFAIGGNAQCADVCADLAGTSIGPDAWLRAAVGKSAETSGVRAFLYTGASVSGTLNPSVVTRSEFAGEEAAYARRLGANAGALPVFAAPSESDRYESSLAAFAQQFRGFGAPFGEGPPGAGIGPISSGNQPAGNYSYSFDSEGAYGGPVRVLVLDDSTVPLSTEKQCWLAEQLAGAEAAVPPRPAIVVGNREVGSEVALNQLLVTGADETTAASCPQATQDGASAYFYDKPEANVISTLSWGAATIPAYGTGSLGYVRIPGARVNEYVAASGFLLASVDTTARNPLTNVAPVTARLIPSLGSLALNALDGTLLRRSQTALFEALARRPEAGFYCSGNSAPESCETVKPDPYVQIPARCVNQSSCATELLPEYRFSSSRPDIANFVKIDPASSSSRAVYLNQEGKPEPDPTSGLLCAFNSGTTTVSVETGGLAYSVEVTVQKGSVARPCGTVPRTDLPGEGTPIEPLGLGQEPEPEIKGGPETLPPPPHPIKTPIVHLVPQSNPPVQIPAHHPLPAKPPAPIQVPFIPPVGTIVPNHVIVPPAPPAAAEPAPPTGTSPVTQPAVSPEPEEEEEAAFDLVHHAVAVRHARRESAATAAYRFQPHGSSVPWLLYALPTLVVIAALSSSGIAGRRRRRELEPAFLKTRR